MNRMMVLVLLGMALSACGLKLSADQYTNLMADLGCQQLSEDSPAAAAVLQKFNATQEDITAFRQKSKPEVMMQVASQIAQKVAACHGVTLPTP